LSTAAIGKVALVEPALIVTLGGTVAALVLPDDRVTGTFVATTAGIVTVPVEALVPAFSAKLAGEADTAKAGPELVAWEPRPLKVSTGKPSHSIEGSKAFVALVSPCTTDVLRRRVRSRVETPLLVHWVPGSKPVWPITSTISPLVPPLRRTTASLPLNQEEPLDWLARASSAGGALVGVRTWTPPAATVPVSAMAVPVLVAPLKYISTRYPAVPRFTAEAEGL
jgi:hypothetical protein